MTTPDHTGSLGRDLRGLRKARGPTLMDLATKTIGGTTQAVIIRVVSPPIY